MLSYRGVLPCLFGQKHFWGTFFWAKPFLSDVPQPSQTEELANHCLAGTPLLDYSYGSIVLVIRCGLSFFFKVSFSTIVRSSRKKWVPPRAVLKLLPWFFLGNLYVQGARPAIEADRSYAGSRYRKDFVHAVVLFVFSPSLGFFFCRGTLMGDPRRSSGCLHIVGWPTQ